MARSAALLQQKEISCVSQTALLPDFADVAPQHNFSESGKWEKWPHTLGGLGGATVGSQNTPPPSTALKSPFKTTTDAFVPKTK